MREMLASGRKRGGRSAGSRAEGARAGLYIGILTFRCWSQQPLPCPFELSVEAPVVRHRNFLYLNLEDSIACVDPIVNCVPSAWASALRFCPLFRLFLPSLAWWRLVPVPWIMG